MVKLCFHDRLQPPARMLAWLVDEAGGTATIQKLATMCFGPKGLYKAVPYVKSMCQNGWLETHDGKDGKVSTGTVTVTGPGYLWRDYFAMGEPDFSYNRIEDHAYRRAFKLALEPLAKAGMRWRDANERDRFIMQTGFEAIGISARQALMAAEMLFPSGKTSVIYPWTKGYLTRKFQTLTPNGRDFHAKPVPR